ncbi:hypothetical protein [Actinokineospora inagensis]|uniref:hypothetical protein n=1 Tax=Actinokineospora inagensis TaxID=103730 RepID=UPI0012FA8E52|nr:hypothetical protein [Actinokineospora inagensis]
MVGAVAVGGAILLVIAAIGHVRGRWWLAVAELTVAASVVLTPYAVVALYGAFTFYLADRRLRRPGSPCGCFRGEGPVTWLVVGRAAFFAIGSTAEPAVQSTLALAAGFVLAMTWWLLPQLTGVVGKPLGYAGAVEHRQQR